MTDVPAAAWWRHAVGYEVYVRSFADSDGDGVGDLPGLRDRLDHLAWLGVDIVWITPFYPSPMHDHGYDVADYTGVHPEFGSLDDLDAVVARAHELGLRVVIDLVPNHTSSAHPWFRAARSSPDSPYRDYYIWRDGRVPGPPEQGGEPPNNWVSVFGGRAWSYDRASGQWWLHLFLPEQPDLNWANPGVRDEFDRILRFWLERGVDGFRIDVAHALAKHPDLPDIPEARRPADPHDIGDAVSQSQWERYEHPYDIDQEEVTEIYRRWRRVVEPHGGLLLGEVYLQDPAKLARYLNPQDGLHLSFWFKPLHIRWSPEAVHQVLRGAIDEVPDHLAWVQGSHDRSRAATRFGGGDLGRARSLVLATLFMGLPGVPFLYMGEELGLEDVEVPPERSQDPIAVRHAAPERARDNCRTPLPWAPVPGLGFTTAEDAWLPFGDRAPADTVAVQREDPSSWLHRWRRLIEARRSFDLTNRHIQWILEEGDVVAYRRGHTIVAANCGDAPGELPLPEGDWEVGFDSASSAAGAPGDRKPALVGTLRLEPLRAVILHRS
ncbi:MAG TPA: alpha-amylase family glycosyl hydrolase [Egibacteraceae bacterium]|nr:alpha-amylase family glycosyl hydrolase [Egibacteraceae bacterium]